MVGQISPYFASLGRLCGFVCTPIPTLSSSIQSPPPTLFLHVQSCQRTADLVQQAEDLGEDGGTLSGVDDIIVERSGLEEGGRRVGRKKGGRGGGSECVAYATENGRLCGHHLLKDSALLQLQKRVGSGCTQRRGSDIKQNGGRTTHCSEQSAIIR